MPDTPVSRRQDSPELWMASLYQQRIATPLGAVNVWLGGRPDGPAMVFWPSLLVDSSMWRYQYEHFAPTYRVVLVDPPGPVDRTFCTACSISPNAVAVWSRSSTRLRSPGAI